MFLLAFFLGRDRIALFSEEARRLAERYCPGAITLIAASFISLAFMGFSGIVDALFA